MMSVIVNRSRSAVSTALLRRGFPMKWAPPQALLPDHRMLSVDFQMLAAHLMLTVPKPFFIGIGANDGVTHDPIYPFIRDRGWQGVMVEPIPEAFAALTLNYANIRGVSLVQAAIGATDGEGTIYSVPPGDARNLRMTLHSSFSRDVLLQAAQWYPDLEARIVERTVPVMTFETLLAKAAYGRAIDVLKIDVEGYDLEILKTVDLARLSPRLITAEHANMPRVAKEEMADILLRNGYRLAMTDLDMLGYKEPN